MKNIMDEEKIRSCIDKINIYTQEEEMNFDAISEILGNIIYYYHTHNTEKLKNIQFEYKNKLLSILRLHNMNIVILNKNIEKYKNTKLQVWNILEKVNTNL